MNQADPDLPSQMDNLSMNSHGKRAKSMACWTSRVSPLHAACGHQFYMSMPQLMAEEAIALAHYLDRDPDLPFSSLFGKKTQDFTDCKSWQFQFEYGMSFKVIPSPLYFLICISGRQKIPSDHQWFFCRATHTLILDSPGISRQAVHTYQSRSLQNGL